MLAMVFAIEKINKDLNILFNMSLGFYLFNVDFLEMKAVEGSLTLLSGESPPAPQFLTTAAGPRRAQAGGCDRRHFHRNISPDLPSPESLQRPTGRQRILAPHVKCSDAVTNAG